MRRRELIGFAGVAFFAWPRAARAQSQLKVARLGYLGFGPPAASATRVQALRACAISGMSKARTSSSGSARPATVEQLNEVGVELVRMNVDIIFATSSTESEPT